VDYILHEKSLHSSLKSWYSIPGDQFEVKIDHFIIDIVRKDLLIEIQTRNFSSIKKKIKSLIKNYNVRLVYPIPRKKWIVQVTKRNEEIKRRISPKKGKLFDVFNELIRISDLINEKNFTIEVLMTEEEEIRKSDGKGSWRRKGVSIEDRKLLDVYERIIFYNNQDFCKFLPENLDQPFTNKSLAKSIKLPINLSRKITYCLRKMGLIKEVGKNRNKLFFERILDSPNFGKKTSRFD
jgi:hypothetical protein